MRKLLLITMILSFVIPSTIDAQRKNRKSKKNAKKEVQVTKPKAKPKSKKPKYSNFVNKKTKVSFDVHENKNKFYYEVPDNLIRKRNAFSNSFKRNSC